MQRPRQGRRSVTLSPRRFASKWLRNRLLRRALQRPEFRPLELRPYVGSLDDWIEDLRRDWEAQDLPWPGWKVEASNILLYAFVRRTKPRRIVETGVQYGMTSSYFLRGLADNDSGNLYSIDLPHYESWTNEDGRLDNATIRKAEETGLVVPKDLRGRWELTLGRSQDQLPTLLNRVGPIDLFFHDSDHTESLMLWEYENAWANLVPGGWLLSDDVDQSHAFEKFCPTHEVRGFRWPLARGTRGAVQKPADRG